MELVISKAIVSLIVSLVMLAIGYLMFNLAEKKDSGPIMNATIFVGIVFSAVGVAFFVVFCAAAFTFLWP